MIKNYAISRKDFLLLIKYSEKTKDGYYWYPIFPEICSKNGHISDEEYYYDREYFIHKLYFKPEELDAFLSKKKMEFDIENMYRKSIMFYDTNKELKYLKLEDTIPGSEFKLYELIDCFEYIYSDCFEN